MDKGWPERWWTTALLAVVLTGIVAYDVWWVVEVLAKPVVDWWGLLGPCLGGTWLALMAVQAARRAITLHRRTRAVIGDTQADH